MGDQIDRHGFRANVGIILVDDERRLFWARRTGKRGWQFPQGGIDPHESPDEAMFRELYEEVGLEASDVELLGSTRGWLRYRLPKRFRRRDSHPVCIGQKQRWFLLRLACGDDKVCVEAGDQRPEFDDWRWLDDFWTPVKEVIYFKRHVYEKALSELGTILYPDGLPARPEWLREGSHRRGQSGRGRKGLPRAPANR